MKYSVHPILFKFLLVYCFGWQNFLNFFLFSRRKTFQQSARLNSNVTLQVHNISLVKKEPNNNTNNTNTCLPDGAQLQAMPSQASQLFNSQQLASLGPVGQETSQLGIRLPAGTELLARPSQASQLFHYQMIARPNQTSQGMSQLLKNETESKLQLPDLRTRLGPANPKVREKIISFVEKYVKLFHLRLSRVF